MKMPTLENSNHSSQGHDQDVPVPAIALGLGCTSDGRHPATFDVDDVPVLSDDYLTQVKLEDSDNVVKEEKVEIKIEDKETCEGSCGANSFSEANQYKDQISGKHQELGKHCRNIDGTIALGLTLRKEVKEESCAMCHGKGPPPEDEIVKEENLVLHDEVVDEDFEPAVSGYNCEDADDVKPLLNSSGISHPLNSFLKTPNSSRPKLIERKRNLKLKGQLNWLFNSSDKMYHCNHCRYKAKYAQTMEYHRATHTGEKPFECKFCDYKASHPTTLRRHMRRHTGEKPHACKHCDYKAVQPTALVNHVRCMHTGEKPYSCDVCPFRAHDHGSLAGHKLTHLLPDEKPFECEICGIKMTRRTHLLRHARSKHPGKNISLVRRFSATTKTRSFVGIYAKANRSQPKKQPKLFKRSKAFEEIFGSSSESSSSLSSEDEINSPIIKQCQTFSSDDQEYRPDRFVTPLSASSLSDRPRRSIVAPKKLDL